MEQYAYTPPSRVTRAWKAWKGEDVLVDQGKREVAPDGTIYTVGKLALAIWVPTDDPAIACGAVADGFERLCPAIEWGGPEGECAEKYRKWAGK